MKAKYFFSLILILFSSFLFSDPLIDKYNYMLMELGNFLKVGYRERSIDQNYLLTAQGPLSETNCPIHYAINGKGFFKVLDIKSNKIYYTRFGVFFENKKGQLLTKEGYLLQSNLNRLDTKKSKLDGIEYQTRPLNPESVEIERFTHQKFYTELYYPTNENEIIIVDEFYFTFSSVTSTTDNEIIQGFLEMSTVRVMVLLKALQDILIRIEHASTGDHDFMFIETKKYIIGTLIKLENIQPDPICKSMHSINFYLQLSANLPLLKF